MSKTNSTVNFLIHDANGKPQVVKVVRNAKNQVLPQINIKSNPVKVIKLPVSQEGQGPVFKAVRVSNLKSVPKVVKAVSTPPTFKAIAPKVEPGSPEDKKLIKELLKSKQSPSKKPEETKVLEPYVNIAPGPAPELRVTSSKGTENPELRVTSSKGTENPELRVTSSKGTENPELKVTSLKGTENPELRVTSSKGTETNPSSTMSHGTRRRHDSDNDVSAVYTTKRRKHADKVGKGLRHFSMKVCEKVRTKGFTSYNEVADELVVEFAAGIHGSGDSQQYDQKNIRRRVYDALNVLMAMNIISKEKKEIRWLGLPTNSVQECNSLEKEKQTKLDEIQKKTQQLQELILQHISFKSLIERNKEAENKGVKPSPSSAIHLPFIVVNTSDKALIDCSISNDKTEYMFNFNKRFQIHDDIDILKRMGLLFGLDKGECTEADIERAKSMVPKSLETYVEQMAKGDLSNVSSILEDELEDVDEEEEEEDNTEENEAEDDQPGAEPNDYSDDSSDVDV